MALLSDVAQVSVLGVGASRVAVGDLTPGVLLAFLLYLGLFFAPVQQLSQVFDTYQQARVGLTRISELLRTPTSVPEASGEAVPVPVRLRGEVELREVRFTYPGAAFPALDGVSLRVAPGETVALARAELADPDLLLFDEATVLAAGDRVTSRRTAFVVAHRLATAAPADRILVLHAGRIVEQGTHAELLAAGGMYTRLWQAGDWPRRLMPGPGLNRRAPGKPACRPRANALTCRRR